MIYFIIIIFFFWQAVFLSPPVCDVGTLCVVQECFTPNYLCSEEQMWSGSGSLHGYAADYGLTLKETGAAVPMWLPDPSMVARLGGSQFVTGEEKYSLGRSAWRGGGWFRASKKVSH